MPRIAPAIVLDASTEATLNCWVQSPSTPHSLALRSRIVLAAAAGRSNQQIASDLDVPPVTVGKWRRSFAKRGLEGLRDATRSGRPPKHDAAVWRKVQVLARQQPESQRRWSVRALAREVGLPHSTVHAILRASELDPHRFTISPDPGFGARLLDIVGLYLNPPETALVLCVDRQVRHSGAEWREPAPGSNRPRRGAPGPIGRGARTLEAALEAATDRVAARVRGRRTPVSLLRFMNDVVEAYPNRHLQVVMNHSSINNEAARLWLARHPHVRLHHTPTHTCWVNLVECLFSILGQPPGAQRSRPDLPEFLKRFIASYNPASNPFTWTKDPEPQRLIQSTPEGPGT